MNEDINIAIIKIQERCTTIDNKASAAHGRIDKTENLLREDIRDIKRDIIEVKKIMFTLRDWMNHSKGWTAAMLLISATLGALLGYSFSLLKNVLSAE